MIINVTYLPGDVLNVIIQYLKFYPSAMIALKDVSKNFNKLTNESIKLNKNSITEDVVVYGHIPLCEHFINICVGGDWIKYAAQKGQLEILKWIHDNKYAYANEMTCADAAKYGHLEILKWLRQNGCPWTKITCSAAALNRHFEILKMVARK